jgi:hypothetical protein
MRGYRRHSAAAGVLAVSLLAALGGASTANAETPELVEGAAAIAYLNTQRQANGIPPFTKEEASLASWCPNERGGVGGSGDRVLSPIPYWDAAISPWAPIPSSPAPFHEALIYDPYFMTVGEVNAEGPYNGEGAVLNAACASIAGELPAPSTPQGAVFYAALGASHVPPAVIADEDYTPAQALGLPPETGPNVIAYAMPTAGHEPLPWAPHATAAITLTAASGQPVSGIEAVAGFDCFVIVPPPLQPDTEYSGEAVIAINATESVTDKLHFTTGPEELQTAPPTPPLPPRTPAITTPAVQPTYLPPPTEQGPSASVAILSVRLTRTGATVELRLGAAGVTTIKAAGFKRVVKMLAAGEHRVALHLTNQGKRTRRRHALMLLSVTVDAGRATPVSAREKIHL